MMKSARQFARLTTLAASVLLALGAAAATSPAVTDADITFALERAMVFDAGVPSNDIDVVTNDGIVTLTGAVDNVLARERALRIAESVRGVRAIVDRMTVERSRRADDEIRRDVTNALLYDPATDSYEITTRVSNGVVTLSGTVDSWQEKQLALDVAKGVRGVTQVIDAMNVTYATARTDAEIAAEVRRALMNDVWVDAAFIGTSVKDGAITLTGTVGSLAEKRRAISDAWVRGVRDVNADALKVEPWAKDAMRKDRPASSLSDAQIRDAVRDALLYDPRVLSFNPTVTVTNGVVTLTGVVDNVKARRAAAQDARNTAGVRRVRNYLKVRPAQPVADDKLARTLKDALAFNTITESYEIDVKADDGVVTLSGTVDSFLEKSEAEDVALRTNGVVAVRNNLTVRYPALTHHDYDYDPWWDYSPDYGRYSAMRPDWSSRTFTTDAELEEDIEYELFWSPFVDSTAVDVEVNNGVATITGTVENWRAFSAATQNAFEAGALGVVNNLKVE